MQIVSDSLLTFAVTMEIHSANISAGNAACAAFEIYNRKPSILLAALRIYSLHNVQVHAWFPNVFFRTKQNNPKGH